MRKGSIADAQRRAKAISQTCDKDLKILAQQLFMAQSYTQDICLAANRPNPI